ncbi:hypothetical protein, conserved [Eimeria necatrix]|uniref:Inward rectifier potassium channel C-terminal domain-containing protein n=1 Tax=Eimeria necatrix TaxID=51315 RepID=U6MRE8_9EIME|nr:hypothetical protein, conserved [Eimeria necatrix]CDJ65024.1 hypothetical protein, conserved [Eimeria necatrix]
MATGYAQADCTPLVDLVKSSHSESHESNISLLNRAKGSLEYADLKEFLRWTPQKYGQLGLLLKPVTVKHNEIRYNFKIMFDSHGYGGVKHVAPEEWGSTVRIRSFHVEFPEDEDTPATHTLSLRRDFVRRDGGLNLEHRFRRSGGYVEFLINDRFHAILALRWLPLVALVFITVVICAAILSLILFIATEARADECLGSSSSNWDYFFFVVETMFAIGYGSPRRLSKSHFLWEYLKRGVHRRGGLSIRQFSMFHTDTPLEFMALPITVTVDQSDIGSPLRDITEADLRNHGECYELLALLSFTDNRTSRTVEVCRSWRLNAAVWDESFVPIVRQSGPDSSRAFEIDVDNLSTTRVGAAHKYTG